MSVTTTNGKKLKIFMIGALPLPLGGIAVSFKVLVDLLKKRDDIDIEIVDFAAIRNKNGNSISGFCGLLYAILAKVIKLDIITVYFAPTALPSLGLFLLLLARILCKPLIIRTGGCDYIDTGSYREWLGHHILKQADLFLAETKKLVQLAKERGISTVEWYPTSRLRQIEERSFLVEKNKCQRFIYVGQIRAYKGIQILVDVAKRLPADVTIDLYGPWFDDLNKNMLDNSSNVFYQGVLKPEDVVSTMRKYDAAVLPTIAATEGYPGMVLESYAAGLPIIASKIGGIPEIVDDSVGILVEPNNIDALFQALMRLIQSQELFKQFCANTHVKAEFFSSERWADEFVSFCQELYHSKNTGR